MATEADTVAAQVQSRVLRRYFSDAIALIDSRSPGPQRSRQMLERAGLAWCGTGDLNPPPDYSDYWRFLHVVGQEPGLGDIGVRMGQRRRFEETGIFGYAMLSTGTVGDLLRLCVRYFRVAYGGIVAHTVVEGRWTVVHVRPPPGDTLAAEWPWQEQLLSAFAFQMKQVDPDVSLQECEAQVSIRDARRLQAVRAAVPFAVTVGDAVELRFPSAWMTRPLSLADPQTARVLEAECERALSGFVAGSVAQTVRSILRDHLVDGRLPSQAEVAGQLCRAERTLRDQLAVEGTSFRQLSTQVRSELACHYLRSTDWPVSQIAYQLGYEHPSNFFRAFNRALGMAPERFRQQHVERS